MKRILALCLSLMIAFGLFINASATNNDTIYTNEDNIYYYDDGSYLIETIQSYDTRATQTKSGIKRTQYFSSDDELQWTATLSGTFTYTGSTSTCTSSSITYSISNSKWKIPTATASKSGNKAIGYVEAKYYFFGIPINTLERTITLTCSATGSLS